MDKSKLFQLKQRLTTLVDEVSHLGEKQHEENSRKVKQICYEILAINQLIRRQEPRFFIFEVENNVRRIVSDYGLGNKLDKDYPELIEIQKRLLLE